MSNVTIKDVAALAGVSVGTVSMVLNNSPKICDKTEEIVRDSVKKLGYRRNPYARSLSIATSHTIGFLVPDLLNPFFGEMAAHLQKAVEAKGYSLMFGLTNESSKREGRLLEEFLDHGVDGIIDVPVIDPSLDVSHFYPLMQSGYPLVFISSYYKNLSQDNCIMTNLYKGAYEMTTHLLKSGHRRVILISGNPQLVPFEERIQGFKQAHIDQGLPFSSNQIIEAKGMSFQGGYDAIKEVFDTLKPDAIFAINDIMAMGIIGSLRSCGIRVPEDVSVAGYDDLSISGLLETPLTTVKQPLEEMCDKTVNVLFSCMEGKPQKGRLLLDPSVILRKSAADIG